MPTSAPRILVTGATGQLGALVIDELLKSVPAADIGGLVRASGGAKADALKAQGVQTRVGDYDDPASLGVALAGIERLLFVSSNDLEHRDAQHRNVVEAAKAAGVSLVAYTSLLHADRSPLGLAKDHRRTEALLSASGLPSVFLRNGWYTENHTACLPGALAHGALLGAAGEGRFASASRADYAAAAAAVLTSQKDHAGRIYELGGDTAYTLTDLAAEVSRQIGRNIGYRNLPQADYEAVLIGAGLPAGFASVLADSDAGAAEGGLFDDGGDLSRLIGRPTTPWTATVGAALRTL